MKRSWFDSEDEFAGVRVHTWEPGRRLVLVTRWRTGDAVLAVVSGLILITLATILAVPGLRDGVLRYLSGSDTTGAPSFVGPATALLWAALVTSAVVLASVLSKAFYRCELDLGRGTGRVRWRVRGRSFDLHRVRKIVQRRSGSSAGTAKGSEKGQEISSLRIEARLTDGTSCPLTLGHLAQSIEGIRELQRQLTPLAAGLSELLDVAHEEEKPSDLRLVTLEDTREFGGVRVAVWEPSRRMVLVTRWRTGDSILLAAGLAVMLLAIWRLVDPNPWIDWIQPGADAGRQAALFLLAALGGLTAAFIASKVLYRCELDLEQGTGRTRSRLGTTSFELAQVRKVVITSGRSPSGSSGLAGSPARRTNPLLHVRIEARVADGRPRWLTLGFPAQRLESLARNFQDLWPLAVAIAAFLDVPRDAEGGDPRDMPGLLDD